MILDQVINQRIKEKKAKLDNLRPLSSTLVARLREQIIVDWTYNSNAIEGTKLSLKETELVIEQGLTIKGVPIKDHLEAINHKEAILFLEELVETKKFKINTLLIRQIHQLVLNKIDKDNAGKYRMVQVKITGANYNLPYPAQIPVEMKRFENWLSNKKNQQDIIDYASLAHFKLVNIHPFVDGNGRTARLLMNLILINSGYPPTIILKIERAKYYETLRLANKKEFKPFVDFIGRCIERSLTWYLDAVLPENKKRYQDKWIILSQIAGKTPYSQEYLSLLARRGKIEAVKKGRNWYSSFESVNKYLKEK
ncbi:hypothetical protein A2630_04790 [Candidatus Woesebacteria bacterium RIFCSPHIGHO2_01_FULL_44_10]|uniref:Fido domain-containing protein n=1 Tax=Candidatus Woesebacteria bacterium RIFCSPLOWO2_01_FULL_44_14 TaxID=1802525 RepID=A0A1F8BZW6_9BACT|nr:MAG: hypothetical protein A2630_04790 [Candidatus Woesebacteria bacterium RIFCSPHIGHO2_01_FULL_44_10]OGM54747.1 MAG: hypothetical protein A3F62_01605 [Candidatus Woesebacteria bacterium RIFCSPHIGHO2_12_FULL_44_11]OGM69651.1 MAG: hypothetical protein A2975_00890 [Candidatus Woesebacteria bacterium RIFCSPLOWO2_01_FULL_44_14]